MKVGQLISPQMKSSLTKLMQAHLPIQSAFNVKRLIIAVDAEVDKYNAMRASLIEELSLKNEDGTMQKTPEGYIEFTPENKAEFFKRENELKQLDVLLQPLKISDLGGISLSAQDLITLEGILKD